MIKRIAKLLRRGVEPATKIVSNMGVAAFGLLVLMLIYEVIARKAFNAPLRGDIELSKFGMVLITFFFVSAQYFKADQMVLDTLVEKLPGKIRSINSAIIYFFDCAILAILSWQLFVQAKSVQDMHQTSTTLGIPVNIFVYTAAVCTVLLTLVFLTHFFNSLAEIEESKKVISRVGEEKGK